ncbi:MAG: type II toxin-antitoxin system RatA family toxin [Pseudomonadota bacterium]
MPSYSTRRRIAFTPNQMFDLVADVDSYPEFLPLCESLVVKSRSVQDGNTVLVATMGIGYKAIRERFTTRVTLLPDQNEILVEYLDGPFRHLENRWKFLPHPTGCEIDFFITYEFRSRMLGMLMGAMFDRAFRKFASAFEQRARIVYRGSSEGAGPQGSASETKPSLA